jgi:hypothetical protein
VRCVGRSGACRPRGGESLEAAQDVLLGRTFGGATGDVLLGWLVRCGGQPLNISGCGQLSRASCERSAPYHHTCRPAQPRTTRHVRLPSSPRSRGSDAVGLDRTVGQGGAAGRTADSFSRGPGASSGGYAAVAERRPSSPLLCAACRPAYAGKERYKGGREGDDTTGFDVSPPCGLCSVSQGPRVRGQDGR